MAAFGTKNVHSMHCSYHIRSDGAGGKFALNVPLTLCNCNCNVIFLLVMFFLTHSLSAILATKSDLKMPSTNRALNPGRGGNSCCPGVPAADPPVDPLRSGASLVSITSSSSFNKDKLGLDENLIFFCEINCCWLELWLWNVVLLLGLCHGDWTKSADVSCLFTSAESSSSLSQSVACRLKKYKKEKYIRFFLWIHKL